jgi:hypothetical protein
VKSNLNLPLKFLIRLLSSFLPKEAMEVAVCSKYPLEAMFCTPEKQSCILSLTGAISIVRNGKVLWPELPRGVEVLKLGYYGIKFFLSLRGESDNFYI